MAKEVHVAILYGGKSAEHDISVMSAKNIYASIDKSKYDVTLVEITLDGQWRLVPPSRAFLSAGSTSEPADVDDVNLLLSFESDKHRSVDGPPNAGEPVHHRHLTGVDVIFPVLHGVNGEDGTVQGLLRLIDVPFVGAGVLGSAVGMDKDVMKRLLKAAGHPVPKFSVVPRVQRHSVDFDTLASELGLPLFVKPANAGSSIGISRVAGENVWESALDLAFQYDTKVIVEAGIKGRELECAVIGNEVKHASAVGEIRTAHEFYTYEAKYQDDLATELIIPADIPDHVREHIKDLSCKVCETLCVEGMARVDLFLSDDGEIFVNEINTIPGFTDQSMFPLLWKHEGVGFTDLIDRLIELALQRGERDGNLKVDR